MRDFLKVGVCLVLLAGACVCGVAYLPMAANPQAIEYIGDTPEGWKVYRCQGTGRTSGYVAIPPR